MIPLLLIVIAAASYFLGTFSGSAVIARYVFRRDLHKNGAAPYAALSRQFGTQWAAAAVGVDAAKTVVAVIVGGLLMLIPGQGFPVIGRLFAGFCCAIGHMWPVQRGLRGSRAFVVVLTTLWLTDWRVGLFALGVFVALLATAQYLSLAELAACFTGAVAAWIFVDADQMKGLAGVLALFTFLLVLWHERGSVIRLVERKEKKVVWGRRPESKLRDDRF